MYATRAREKTPVCPRTHLHEEWSPGAKEGVVPLALKLCKNRNNNSDDVVWGFIFPLIH